MLRFPKRTFPHFVIVVFERSPETTETGHMHKTNGSREFSLPLSAAEIFLSPSCVTFKKMKMLLEADVSCTVFCATIQKLL